MLYLLLGFTGVLMLLVRFRRGNLRTTLVQFLVTGAAIGFGDLLFNRMIPLYTYRTGLLAGRPDNALGQLMADALFVPAMFSTLMPTGSRWKWLWVAVLVVPVIPLEYAFNRLGLFLYHGWSLWYTVVVFGAFFTIATLYIEWFDRAGYTPVHRAVLVAAGTDLIYHAWELLTSGIIQLWWTEAGLLPREISDRALSMYLFHGLPFMVISFVAIWNGWVRSLAGVTAVAVVMALWLLGLHSIGIYRVGAGWSPIYGGIALSLLAWLAGQLDAWLSSREREKTGALV